MLSNQTNANQVLFIFDQLFESIHKYHIFYRIAFDVGFKVDTLYRKISFDNGYAIIYQILVFSREINVMYIVSVENIYLWKVFI